MIHLLVVLQIVIQPILARVSLYHNLNPLLTSYLYCRLKRSWVLWVNVHLYTSPLSNKSNQSFGKDCRQSLHRYNNKQAKRYIQYVFHCAALLIKAYRTVKIPSGWLFRAMSQLKFSGWISSTAVYKLIFFFDQFSTLNRELSFETKIFHRNKSGILT